MPMPAIDNLSHEAPLNYLLVGVFFCDYVTINLVMFSSWPKLNVCLVREREKRVLPCLSCLILKCLKWS